MNEQFWRRQAPWGLAVMALTVSSALAQTRDPKPVPQPRIWTTPMSPRDRVPQPEVGTGSISGRIVDGVTGRPVARARVRLTGRTPKGPVLTDGTGAFSFTGLPAGPHSFRVERNGYLTVMFPEQGRMVRGGSQPIILAPGESREDLAIQIFRGGSISGRVMDAYGEPLDGAAVMLLGVARQRSGVRAMVQTNDLGEFRLSRLQPGRYMLMVKVQMGFQGGDPGEEPLPQPLPTYYPGSLKREEARVIAVNRGEAISGLEMTLLDGLPSIVQGMVVVPDGQAHSGGSVTARLARDYSGMDGGSQVRPDGSFRLQLPPGEYFLETRLRTGPMNQPSRPENELFGSTRVNVVGGGVESVAILVGRGATASGRVVFEGSRPPPPSPGSARVPIYSSEGQTCQTGQATIAPDWSFKVDGLIGTCGISSRPVFGGWMLKSVMFRGENVTEEPFAFQPDQHYPDVQIVVTDRRTNVELRVSDEHGQITREFVAIAFPAEKSRWENLPRFVQTFTPTPLAPFGANRPPGVGSTQLPPTAPSGRMSGLVPGEYYFVAVDDILHEDTLDPAVLEKLISGAVRFTLTDYAPIEVVLQRHTLADLLR